MLKKEQKNALIDRRVLEYETKIFNLQLDRKAVEAVGDVEQVKSITTRIEALEKAMKAVEEMRE